MRCKRAKELYFNNCDGLLNEAEKMKLQEHLDGCPSCLDMMKQMDHCRELLKDLPEPSLSENFEWNLKRRILEEKTRGFRERSVPYLLRSRWGLKFVTGAVSAAVIAVAAVWVVLGGGGTGLLPRGSAPAGRAGETMAKMDQSTRDVSNVNVFIPKTDFYPSGLRLVSSSKAHDRGIGSARLLPLQSVTQTRENAMRQENEYLKKRIVELERENLQLRKLLYQQRNRR